MLLRMNYTEPSQVAAGDTILWTKVLPEYPASEGWVLKYALRGPAVVDVTATPDGDDHLVSTSGVTVAGTYFVQGYVEKDSERHTVFSGQIKATPNLVTAGENYDGRSHAQKVIDAVEAVIEGRASKAQLEMWVDGEKLAYATHADLMTFRNKYRHELASENRKSQRKNGRRANRCVKISY